MTLAGQRALVTGGAGGIGAAIVAGLLGAGAEVYSLDLPGTTAPEGARPLTCDLANGESVDAAIEALAAATKGELDLFVHCAGITRDGLLWKLGVEAWREVIDVNLSSAFLLLRGLTPLLRGHGRGGAVVLIASINGERGKFGQANYAASKAGLIGLAKTAARELGRFGVRVNCVCPGFIETAMTATLPAEVRERAIAETVLGRPGQPSDVADAVLFFCSDASRHVTGQILRVDGGQLIA